MWPKTDKTSGNELVLSHRPPFQISGNSDINNSKWQVKLADLVVNLFDLFHHSSEPVEGPLFPGNPVEVGVGCAAPSPVLLLHWSWS